MSASHPSTKPLSPEAAAVAWLAGHGQCNRQIAATLGCCQKNVEKHLTKLYKTHDTHRADLHDLFLSSIPKATP